MSRYSYTNEDYLREQLERAERAAAEVERQAQEERERRREEMRAELDYERRQADDWKEAVEKQIGLMGAEARHEEEDDPTEGHYFSSGVAACRRALEIWPIVEETYAEARGRLLMELHRIDDQIVRTVAEQLLLESDGKPAGWRSIANELGSPSMTPSEWLDW